MIHPLVSIFILSYVPDGHRGDAHLTYLRQKVSPCRWPDQRRHALRFVAALQSAAVQTYTFLNAWRHPREQVEAVLLRGACHLS
jgi:hypothetical protein